MSENGDIVVALVGEDDGAEEATVKRFRRGPRGRVWLEPANDAYAPVESEFIRVLGKVTGGSFAAFEHRRTPDLRPALASMSDEEIAEMLELFGVTAPLQPPHKDARRDRHTRP